MKHRIIASIVAVAALAPAAFAQNGTLSPYSRYGYGMLRDNVTAAQQSMGGIGYAMSSGRQTNVMNPASYARVDSLTFLFDMGVDLTCLWSSEKVGDNRYSENQIGGGLNYITMQFPLGKRLGMSVGVLPYSAVGYAFGNTIDNGYANRQGSGSINELYVGLAGRIVGGLNVGVNIAYMFGSTINDVFAVTDGGSTSLYEDELTVRDWHLDAGIQYTQRIGRDVLAVGAVFSPAKPLLGTLRTYAYDVDSNTSEEGEEHSSAKTRHNYSLAASYGAGISYLHDDRLFLEADFTYQPWADAKFKGVKGTLADRYKVAFGGYYQPSQRGSYLRRIQYRAGINYERDYMVVNTNNLRQIGASVGLGFPVPGFKTMVNLGFEYIHRQAYPSALIKENYFNITLGINFNEMWFRKSRIY